MTDATGTGVAPLPDREGLWLRECQPARLLMVERLAEGGEEGEAAVLVQEVAVTAVTAVTKEMAVVTVAVREMTVVIRMETDVKC